MNGYCQRSNTMYNRCYCSPRLAQIDANYKPAIDDILRRLIIIKNEGSPGTYISDAELEEFWQDTFAQYTGSNDMAGLNNALDINWAGSENTMRGQNAFVMGHDYCVQHLRSCAYMTTNLRDVYRSEIARDCTAYENSLDRLKTAGEAILSQVSD
jgi:hypothetical protein